MIIVASSNGKIGMPAAMHVLRQGGTAVDAVEAGIRLVEDQSRRPHCGVTTATPTFWARWSWTPAS